MNDEEEDKDSPGRGGKARWKPGQSANPNGRPKGSKTKAQKALAAANDRAMEKLPQLCAEHFGKSVEEIFRDMNYHPVVHAVSLIPELKDEPALTIKVLGMLMNKIAPDLKSMESTSHETTRIEVVWPNPFERPAIEANVTPALEHVIDIDPYDEAPEGADDVEDADE